MSNTSKHDFMPMFAGDIDNKQIHHHPLKKLPQGLFSNWFGYSKKQSSSSSLLSTQSAAKYVPMYSQSSAFRDLLLDPSMAWEHFPDRYLNELSKLELEAHAIRTRIY